MWLVLPKMIFEKLKNVSLCVFQIIKQSNLVNMKNLLYILVVLMFVAGCKNRTGQIPSNVPGSDYHSGKTVEVLQTSEYTYLLLKDKNREQWVAVPKMEAEKGQTYYYQDGLEMDNFSSKELNRQFESVLFLEGVYTAPPMEQTAPETGMMQKSPGAVTTDKEDVKIEAEEGIVTISQLFENPAAFEGKNVRIKAKVTKFNPAIMGKNWIHLQDGTEYNGKYDLTVTTMDEVHPGEIVTLEGKISLNRDFGYGYRYDVLMEDAKVVR